MRELSGFPDEGPFVSRLTVGLVVMLFGVRYREMAMRGTATRSSAACSPPG